ncbi:MAG: hypothetical protein AAB343_00805 [Patescibacteria group bacterium]
MRTIYIIGTLHLGYVPKDELYHELDKLRPDFLFLELPNVPIEQIKANADLRDEMISAYEWAIKNSVPTVFYDADTKILREDVDTSSPIFQENLDFQRRILDSGQYSWKDFNNEETLHILDTPTQHLVSDPAKEEEREHRMLEKINQHMISKGTVLILTGASHLYFFEKNLPQAIFPFRKQSAVQ